MLKHRSVLPSSTLVTSKLQNFLWIKIERGIFLFSKIFYTDLKQFHLKQMLKHRQLPKHHIISKCSESINNFTAEISTYVIPSPRCFPTKTIAPLSDLQTSAILFENTRLSSHPFTPLLFRYDAAILAPRIYPFLRQRGVSSPANQ